MAATTLVTTLSATMILSAATPAIAGHAGDPDTTDSHFHGTISSDIIVTASVARERLSAASSISVLQGDSLAAALRPGLGETLAHTAGISASSFGPIASRPILRGLQGERAPILTDGIGAIDASGTSADHAVAIDPLLIDRIEVVRGPQALLYGSAAIGGVVNVLDRRIPRAIPDEPVHVQGSLGFGSAATERSAGVAADMAVGPHLVLHADGSYQKSADLRIGGHALSPAARKEALQSAALPPSEQVDADGEPLDFAGNATIRGRLPNSGGRSWTAGAGVAFLTDGGSLGFSYSHLSNRYGVPVRYATQPGHEEEAPVIDLVQNRFDMRGEVAVDGPLLETVKLRVGHASYRHVELEEDGDIGTLFTSKGIEGRLELVQTPHGRWTGATGAQLVVQDFDVRGDEAFLPKNSTTKIGFFSLQQLDFDVVKLQAAVRFEQATLTALPRAGESFASGRRRFHNLSASLGASVRIAEGWRLGANVARSARAPSAEELYASGPHGGTQSWETGDPNLRPERSWGIEAVLRGKGDGYRIEAAAYASRYSGFIYQHRTGQMHDGLPVYETHQGRARYRGFEVEGEVDLFRFGNAVVRLDGLIDHVHATISQTGPAPHIPPLRLLAGLGFDSPHVDLRGEIEHVRAQRRTALFETPTAGHTLVNAAATIRPWGDARPVTLGLSANNIFNVTARRHASLLKDFAPLSGRDIRLDMRFSF